MRWLHKLFSFLGLSLGGANSCLKYDCKEYCGYSPSECLMFLTERWERERDRDK